MKKKVKKKTPQYKVWMNPSVFASRKQLPGKIRQRIRHLIDGLGEEPRPPKSGVPERCHPVSSFRHEKLP